jgi:nitrite reductase/ring-hydroxylating ferredoxin subunit
LWQAAPAAGDEKRTERAVLTEQDLAGRTGPMLADGTALGDLLDFEKREVSLRVLSDPEIYRLELKQIFARSWVGLAHEAEIPNPGDFVLRSIGEDPVIVTRDRDGDVRILLNVCAHRGMEICWADAGNQAQFKCPYHGWVFDSAGNLLGAPFEQEMYGDWDKSEFGLRTAAVGLFHGRIFGNFDRDADPLDEYLADAAWYLDRNFASGEPEMEVLLSPRRYMVNANWKISADNNSGDTYHGQSLHQSLSQLGLAPPNVGEMSVTLKVSSRNGHGLVGFDLSAMGMAQPGADDDPVAKYSFATMMFPATFGLGGGAYQRMSGPNDEPILIASIGSLVPRGPGRFEMWTGSLIDKRAPEGMRAMLTRPGLQDLGGVDDIESWPSIERASRGALGAEQTMKYNARDEPGAPDGWTGPGTVYAGYGQDDNQWNFWLRWYDLMTTP